MTDYQENQINMGEDTMVETTTDTLVVERINKQTTCSVCKRRRFVNKVDGKHLCQKDCYPVFVLEREAAGITPADPLAVEQAQEPDTTADENTPQGFNDGTEPIPPSESIEDVLAGVEAAMAMPVTAPEPEPDTPDEGEKFPPAEQDTTVADFDDWRGFARHDLSEYWGDIPEDQFAEMTAAYMTDPQPLTITLFEGQVLDGWHRYMMSLAANVKPVFEVYGGDDPAGYVIKMNNNRRHQTPSQRAGIVVRIRGWVGRGQQPENVAAPALVVPDSPIDNTAPPAHPVEPMPTPVVARTAEQMASEAGVSVSTIENAKTAERAGLGDQVISGELSVGEAARQASQQRQVEAPPTETPRLTRTERLQLDLDEARDQLAQQTRRADDLELENRALRDSASEWPHEREQVFNELIAERNGLRAELATLRNQYNDAQSSLRGATARLKALGQNLDMPVDATQVQDTEQEQGEDTPAPAEPITINMGDPNAVDLKADTPKCFECNVELIQDEIDDAKASGNDNPVCFGCLTENQEQVQVGPWSDGEADETDTDDPDDEDDPEPVGRTFGGFMVGSELLLDNRDTVIFHGRADDGKRAMVGTDGGAGSVIAVNLERLSEPSA